MVIIISKRNRITKINFNLQKLGTAKYFYPKFIEFKVGLLKAVPIILKNLALICGHTACILSVLTILNVVNLKSFCKKINEFKDRLNTNVNIVWQNVSCFVVIFLNVFLL